MLAGGLFRGGGGGATVAAPGTVGGPEGEVVPEELHDEGGVLVALLIERVQLRYGVVEGLKRRRKNQFQQEQDPVPDSANPWKTFEI